LAIFLNASAITSAPPTSWRTAKVVPLYKGKGDATHPENYRSIAIPPPFAKVFMATINQRLTTTAHAMNLHAPTQAGFRTHHTTVEQALILQTLIQHSLKTNRKLGLVFIDLRRAYDSINREKLW
jgi:Reverse transcriptase (RNA-dependent DNA polymerase)